KKMALELFKPFVMRELVNKGYTTNIKSAKRMVERSRSEVWDVLDEVIHEHPVLLNRAPTLHRLGIQAFMPVLVEGSAIQIQPLPVGKAPLGAGGSTAEDIASMSPLPFQNAHYDRKLLRTLVAELYRLYGSDVTASVVNDIKRLGFRYATQAGITVSAMDIPHPDSKWQIIRATEKEVADVERMYRRGVMTEDERYRKVIELWQRAYEEVGNATEHAFDKFSPIWMMMGSGARGNIQQIRQLAGMRGLMADPTGRIIDLPIQANFTEGLT